MILFAQKRQCISFGIAAGLLLFANLPAPQTALATGEDGAAHIPGIPEPATPAPAGQGESPAVPPGTPPWLRPWLKLLMAAGLLAVGTGCLRFLKRGGNHGASVGTTSVGTSRAGAEAAAKAVK